MAEAGAARFTEPEPALTTTLGRQQWGSSITRTRDKTRVDDISSERTGDDTSLSQGDVRSGSGSKGWEDADHGRCSAAVTDARAKSMVP